MELEGHISPLKWPDVTENLHTPGRVLVQDLVPLKQHPALELGALMNFTRERVEDGRTHRVTITRSEEVGWQVREEYDSETIKVLTLTDWHRVERILDAFDRPAPPTRSQH